MINHDYEYNDLTPHAPLYLSDQERQLVKRHIILPYVIKTLVHDKKIFLSLPLKTHDVYIKVLDNRTIEVFKEVNSIQKKLHDQNIKVFDGNLDSKMGHWNYVIRGNTHEIGFMWSIVRAEVEEYLMDKFSLKY